MAPKKLKSKFEGKCRKCKQAYHVGDSVLWYGKDGTEHEVCPKVGAQPRQAIVLTPKSELLPKSLRDEFAMAAIKTLRCEYANNSDADLFAQTLAQQAYLVADAMMAERAKRGIK